MQQVTNLAADDTQPLPTDSSSSPKDLPSNQIVQNLPPNPIALKPPLIENSTIAPKIDLHFDEGLALKNQPFQHGKLRPLPKAKRPPKFQALHDGSYLYKHPHNHFYARITPYGSLQFETAAPVGGVVCITFACFSVGNLTMPGQGKNKKLKDRLGIKVSLAQR